MGQGPSLCSAYPGFGLPKYLAHPRIVHALGLVHPEAFI